MNLSFLLSLLFSLGHVSAFAPAPSPCYPICYICGSKERKVPSSNASNPITLGGITTTCGLLESGGLTGFIAPAYCKTFPVFKVPKKCGCVSVTPVKTPVRAPVKSPVDGCDSVTPVTAPVTSPVDAPFGPAPSPGYPICYICGSKGLKVPSSNASNPITLGGVTTTCGKLESGGLRGFIGPDYCKTFPIFKVPKQCGCVSVTPVKTPVRAPVKSPVNAPFAPSPSPGYPICYICGSKGRKVPSSNASNPITVGGVTTTCGKLESGGLNGFIRPDYCKTFPVFKIPTKCGCVSVTPAKKPVKAR